MLLPLQPFRCRNFVICAPRKVVFHYAVFHPGQDPTSEDGAAIISSRNLDIGPFELRIGKQFLMPAWETALRTMLVGVMDNKSHAFLVFNRAPRLSRLDWTANRVAITALTAHRASGRSGLCTALPNIMMDCGCHDVDHAPPLKTAYRFL